MRNLPVQHANATENMEQELKRLRPDLNAGLTTHNGWQWQHSDWQWQSTWQEECKLLAYARRRHQKPQAQEY